MMSQKHFSGYMPSQIPGLQKSRNILPILLHNILLQYRRNTNTLSPSVQDTIQLNMGASVLSPEGHLHPRNTALLKIHHTTTHTCSWDTENKHDTYTELPNYGKHRDKVHLITWFLTRRKKSYCPFARSTIRSIQTWQLTIYV